MDIKKLARISDGRVSFSVSTDTGENEVVNSFFEAKLAKIKDSVGSMPSRFKDRENWVKRNIKLIVSEAGVDGDDVSFISDSISKFIVSCYESRLSRVKDSLGKSETEIKTLKTRVGDLNDRLKSYRQLGTVSEVSKKIQDAITSEESARQQAESLRLQQEQSQKEIEDKQKEIDLQKQENEALIQQQKEAQQQAQKMQQEAEERQRELDQAKKDLEEQKRQNDLMAQEQQKQEINRQQDSKIKDDEEDVENSGLKELDNSVEGAESENEENVNGSLESIDSDLLKSYASTMEEFIQSGANYSAEKLKQYADQIGMDDITELTNKVTNYEPLDESSYDSLTENLKKNLSAQGLSIPSLPLIQDSAFTEALAKLPAREKTVRYNVIADAIKNYLLDPNSENEAKLQSYLQGMPDIPLKKLCQQAFDSKWSNEFRKKVADELSASCRKLNDEVTIAIPYDLELEVPSIKFEDIIPDKSIIEPVLSHVQFYHVNDSLNKVIRAYKSLRDSGVLKVTDCCGESPVCNSCESQIPQGWWISSCSPVECTPFIAITVGGLTNIYALPDEGCDRAEFLSKVNNLPVEEQYRVVTQDLIPVTSLLNVASLLGQYDVVTDSSLYKRKLSSKVWVTDSQSKEDFISTLSKMKHFLTEDTYTKVLDFVNKGGKQFRLAISDSVFNLTEGKDFNSIRVKSYQDFDFPKGKVRLYIQ